MLPAAPLPFVLSHATSPEVAQAGTFAARARVDAANEPDAVATDNPNAPIATAPASARPRRLSMNAVVRIRCSPLSWCSAGGDYRTGFRRRGAVAGAHDPAPQPRSNVHIPTQRSASGR